MQTATGVLENAGTIRNAGVHRESGRVTYFPIPYSGESLRSILGRYLLRTGESLHASSFGLAASRSWLSPMPCNVRGMAERLDPSWGFTVENLLVEHTLLPYITAFAPELVRRAIGSDAVGERSRCRRGVQYCAAAPLPSGWRFCPLCLASDLATYGEAHEHLEHMIPGVTACALHGVRLVRIGNRGLGAVHWPEAPSILQTARQHANDETVVATTVQQSIARRSAWVLERGDALSYGALQAALRTVMGSSTCGLKCKTAGFASWLALHDVPAVILTVPSYLNTLIAYLVDNVPCRWPPSTALVVALLEYLQIPMEALLAPTS